MLAKPPRAKARLSFQARRRQNLQGVIEPLEPRLLLAAHITGSATVYPTIQAAVNAAASHATINVDPGVYPELVTIARPLTIRGAQAGIDARSNTRQTPADESILTGADQGNGVRSASFYINANDVTIDGFTVQGETSQSTSMGAGIVIAPRRSGTHILDNIVQNNVAGLYLANYSTTDQALIQHNVFRYNNNPGDNGGRGIYTDGGVSGGNLTNVLIDANFFFQNFGSTGTTTMESGVSLESRAPNSQSNIKITNNTFDSNGKAVLAWNASNILIQGNTVTTCHDQWSAALRFEGGVAGVTIVGNNVFENTGPAVRIDDKGYGANNAGFLITGNDFYGNSSVYGTGASIVVGDGQYDGALDARNNWWGSASGPGGDGPGNGDTITANGNAVSFSPWATAPVVQMESPFDGLVPTAAAPINVADFDQGGSGLAYHDNDAVNVAVQYYGMAAGYRLTAVDDMFIQDGSETPMVGWTAAGEWLCYTVNVAVGGAYRFNISVASAQVVPGAFHMEIDGRNVTGPVVLPDTGSWQNWQTISSGPFTIAAGQHLVRLADDTNGSDGTIGNFKWFDVSAVASAAPAAVTGVRATPGGRQVTLAWQPIAGALTYNIYRGTNPGGEAMTPIATNLAGTEFVDSGLNPGTTYYYQVSAVSLGMEGSRSDETAVTAMLPGDVNGDGIVDFTDLLILAHNYQRGNGTWSSGDLNGDGNVNFADLLILAQNFGKSI